MGSITGMSWSTEDGQVVARVYHSDHMTDKRTFSHGENEAGEFASTEEVVPKEWLVTFPELEIADMDHDAKVAHITKHALVVIGDQAS